MATLKEELKTVIDALKKLIEKAENAPDLDNMVAIIQDGVPELKMNYENGYRFFRDQTGRELFENDSLSRLKGALDEAKKVYKNTP